MPSRFQKIDDAAEVATGLAIASGLINQYLPEWVQDPALVFTAITTFAVLGYYIFNIINNVRIAAETKRHNKAIEKIKRDRLEWDKQEKENQ